ncbi:MAG: hypothetical protein K8F91_11685, partial [Candidatus Obscuribacterales bacterium]|nr:hypothetical protein [Candidatus Obscuribacterales bacterium]
SEYVRLIFEELGIIEGFDKNEKPLYNELFLCHDPQERLLKDGKFQEGLVPNRGLSKKDRADVDRFFKIIRTYREKIGRDGKPAFAIPLDLSSQDPEYVELDNISMADWMAKNDFSTKPINWYVRYCCRDDYGANPDSVSAWAGIHYFAGRRGTAGNAAQNSVVTWPEGNGYIVDKLKTQLADHILTSAMATAIEQKDGQVKTRFFQPGDNRYGQALCDYLVFCAPRFVADHVIKNEPESRIGNLDYAPWLVANISLSSIPSSNGVELSWDNVSYYSESLGYVVSTHQSITTRVDGPTVITYYFPLTSDKPAIERQRLLSTNKEIWAELIVKDLEKMHPGIKENIQNIDLWPWGHGMIQPSPGFLFSESRKQMLLDCGRIIFAHSDMSGISNFEEAQYRGVEAAKKILSLART